MKKTSTQNNIIKYPAKLLAPIGAFLNYQLKQLKKLRREVKSEDPFLDLNRDTDKSSIDDEADELIEHYQVNAIKAQLNEKIAQIKKAKLRIKQGKYGICEKCNQMIDTDRLAVYPETTLCIKCEKKIEKKK